MAPPPPNPALLLAGRGRPVPRHVCAYLRIQGDTTLLIFTVESALKVSPRACATGAVGDEAEALYPLLEVAACGAYPLQFFADPEDGWFNAFDLLIVRLSLSFALSRARAPPPPRSEETAEVGRAPRSPHARCSRRSRSITC